MHILIDIDGVLQFERPDLGTHLNTTLDWKCDHHVFRQALFCDPQYLQSLRGESAFLDVLQRLLPIHEPGLNPKLYLDCWMSDFSLNLELIERLSTVQSRTLSLASNQERWRGTHIASVYSDFTHFNQTYFSYEIGYRKPEQGYFEFILNDLNANPDEVLFVDDTPENILAAETIGIRSICFENNLQLYTTLEQLGLLAFV